jgi:hypothetical protein
VFIEGTGLDDEAARIPLVNRTSEKQLEPVKTGLSDF